MSAMKTRKKEQRRPKQKPRKIATKQAIKPGVSPISGVAPPKNRQFGQESGNPRHSGAWKKEDTLRYKLEKIINGLDEQELEEVLNDPKTTPGVRRLATLLYKSNYEKPENEWRVWEGAMNQAYGLPKQSIEQTNLEPPVPLSPRNAPAEPGLRANLGGGERNSRACADISEATNEAEERQRRRQGVGATDGGASAVRAQPETAAKTRRSRQTGARNTDTQSAEPAPSRHARQRVKASKAQGGGDEVSA